MDYRHFVFKSQEVSCSFVCMAQTLKFGIDTLSKR
jgi:hypothetical protein